MPATIEERIVRCAQHDSNGLPTGDWLAARLGCIGGSRIASVVAIRKRGDGELACRRALKYELLGEWLTGDTSDHFVSEYMKDGMVREPLARAEYELRFGVEVEQVGFVYHPTIKQAGDSPDGLVGSDGMIQIKCPKIETHLEYLDKDEIPADYLPQMTWELACCDDRQWNDFVSYHPRLPEHAQLFIKRLNRTDELNAIIRGMEAQVEAFLAEVETMREKLKARTR